MNILKQKNLILLLSAALFILIQGCEKRYDGPVFTIKGNISDADGKTLYISHIGIDGITPLDSAKLDSTGTFEFRQPKPECYDFYFIALKNEMPITIAIDSTETVTLNSSAKNFGTSYTVEGSPESMAIKEMRELQIALETQVNQMLKSTSPAIVKTRNDIYALIGDFKRNITRQYIASSPDKASAYFALSLTMNGEPLFNPRVNRADSKCYAAVATNLQHRFPNANRTQHLSRIAEECMKATRPATSKEIAAVESKISTAGLFEIELPDVNGDTIKLSSLAGKAVLLDFTIYEDARISSRNILLRELYNKYNDQGLEIYQVSFDNREHFWQQSASNLPWICVRDGKGAGSPNAQLYNLQQLPTFFLINRNSEIVLRDNQIEDLEKEIEKLLKKQ